MKPEEEQLIIKQAGIISDPIRYRILTLLKAGRDNDCLSPVCSDYPQAICPEDLCRKISNISRSKLSYHLKAMKSTGIIEEHREGKRIYYTIHPEGFASLQEWIQMLNQK